MGWLHGCRFKYCPAIHAIALKCAFPAFTVALALFVGWWLYPEPVGEQRWANVEDVNAWWMDGRNPRMGISLKFMPHEKCRRYTVTKVAFPIQADGTVDVTQGVTFSGRLPDKVGSVPLHQTETLYDEAMPEGPIARGHHYQLQVVISCEPESGTTLLDTEVAKTILVVPKESQ